MVFGDLTAIRADQLDLSGLPVDPALAGPPEHVFAVPRPEGRWRRLRRVGPIILFSVVVHGFLAVAFVLLWHAMVADLTSSEPISVEIVNSIPGESRSEPRTDAPALPKSAPLPEPRRETLPPVATPPIPPPPNPVEEAVPPGVSPGITVGKEPGPALVEPPPEPKGAITQPDKNQAGNASLADPPRPAPPEPTPPAETPPVLTTPEAESSVPLPSPEPPPKPEKPPAPLDPNPPHAAADPKGALAAALPMDPMGLPSTFRAMLSSAGQSETLQYKGVVFGMVGRLQGVAGVARKNGLRQGFVILSITVADTGAIDAVSIIQSSGKPEVDAGIMDLIRRQAPLPPPPPGAQRTYTPAISFGAS